MRSLVIGDLNVDIIVSGAPQLPVLGHEIPCEDIQTVMGGAASIFACRLAQLGGKVDIFGKVGNDANGNVVLQNFISSGVNIDKVKVQNDIKTGITISLTYPENRALITCIGGIDNLTESDVNPELFRGYSHLHVSSIYILRKMLGSFSWVFSNAKKHGLTTSLDTNADPLNKYEYVDEILDHVDIFLPNDREAKAISGSNSVHSALEKLSEKVPVVVIKRGEKGAIGRHNNKTVTVKPLMIKPIDTTGAGDSFDAGLIYYYLYKNEGFKASMEFANTLGALSCLYIGGAEKKITESIVLNFNGQQKPAGKMK